MSYGSFYTPQQAAAALMTAIAWIDASMPHYKGHAFAEALSAARLEFVEALSVCDDPVAVRRPHVIALVARALAYSANRERR